MQSTITRDFVVNNAIASFPMKEYPNYCGIEGGLMQNLSIKGSYSMRMLYQIQCMNDSLKSFLIKTEIMKRLISIYIYIYDNRDGGYTLSEETMEAMQIRNNYLADKITEVEYKRWCLEYNLRTV